MDSPDLTIPAVYQYCDPDPIRYGELSAEEIVVQVQMESAIPCSVHLYDGQFVYVSGRKVTDKFDRYSGWTLQGERWELEPVCGADAMVYPATFPLYFRRLGLEELRRDVIGRSDIRQKALVKIRRLLAEAGSA